MKFLAPLWHIQRVRRLPKELLSSLTASSMRKGTCLCCSALSLRHKDELIRAITARSARQRSSEYSDDFDSDEIVSLGDFSDTSADENSVNKKMNDFHISDDEEKNPSKLSFLKTKKLNSNITKDEPVCAIKNDEETAPEGCEDIVVKSFSESQNNNEEFEKYKIKMKPKPRIRSIKSISSGCCLIESQSTFSHPPIAVALHTPRPVSFSFVCRHGTGTESCLIPLTL
nr:microtubule-associated protein 9-like [Aotus nancymaae]